MINISKIYTQRFNLEEQKQKNILWKILCKNFLQKYIKTTDIILDIGAGYCEFINNIQGKTKYAVDIDENIIKFASNEVKVFQTQTTNLSCIDDKTIDVAFASNFFEHLKDKNEIIKTLKEVYRVLKQEGKFLIIQPNIKYAYKEYWDFFDHYIPITHFSLIEALNNVGFEIKEVRPKFLPFTTKTTIPKKEFLLKIYLRYKWLQKIFGKQSFILSEKF
ncbi:MAG: class I SAM-dependent methyltransferase [bacterium]|nr:class I SAM-dependent methyltransferase [bacterium]